MIFSTQNAQKSKSAKPTNNQKMRPINVHRRLPEMRSMDVQGNTVTSKDAEMKSMDVHGNPWMLVAQRSGYVCVLHSTR